LLCKAVKDSKKILQVGTQQRSEYNNMFLTAVALCQQGRIGKLKRVTCVIGGGDKGGPFKKEQPPEGLNWDLWLGHAAKVHHIRERCRYQFRWWYESSGGKLTDWGAPHVDIAQWAIGMDESGPSSVEIAGVELPVKFEKGMPTADDSYNTATKFTITCK